MPAERSNSPLTKLLRITAAVVTVCLALIVSGCGESDVQTNPTSLEKPALSTPKGSIGTPSKSTKSTGSTPSTSSDDSSSTSSGGGADSGGAGAGGGAGTGTGGGGDTGAGGGGGAGGGADTGGAGL